MNFSELIQNRTSVRSFRDKTVKNDLIEKIVSESLEAPTSCNQQLQKYIVVNDKELLNSLVDECGGVEHIKHAPIAVVMLYQLGWNHKRGSHIQSLGAIVDHLILSATDNGLSCVWNAGIGNDGKIRETLKIPAEFGIFCIVSIGYKSDTKVHKKPPRNNLSYFLSYNEFTFKMINITPSV